jgi:hypothetical protein
MSEMEARLRIRRIRLVGGIAEQHLHWGKLLQIMVVVSGSGGSGRVGRGSGTEWLSGKTSGSWVSLVVLLSLVGSGCWERGGGLVLVKWSGMVGPCLGGGLGP